MYSFNVISLTVHIVWLEVICAQLVYWEIASTLFTISTRVCLCPTSVFISRSLELRLNAAVHDAHPLLSFIRMEVPASSASLSTVRCVLCASDT
ncbi:hypothetical protein Droror1_Dr00000907 [Drosera rotundifolia]